MVDRRTEVPGSGDLNAKEPVERDGTGLATGTIGLGGVLFQSITSMAPAGAVALAIPAGIIFGAGSQPLAVIIALIACLFVAVSIGQLAKHLPSAGSFYTYVTNGIHPAVGFLVAWAYSFVELLIGPFVVVAIGFVVGGTLNSEFGVSNSLWWPWPILAAVLVFTAGYFGIKTSARVGEVVGVVEIVIFLALAVTLIVKAGSHNSLAPFGTGLANNPQYKGFSGVIAGSIFTILAFTGFEAAAPLAEETTNPGRNVQRAVVLSCLAIGATYLITTYAATVFYGSTRMVDFVSAGDGNPWQNLLGRQAWGALGFLLVFIAIVNSALGNANSGSNASTRTLYAMGRIRLLPSLFTNLHPRHRSPVVALVAQLIVSIGVSLWLGAQYTPYIAFTLLSTLVVDIFIPMYMLLNLACIGYYWRFRRSEANWFLHGLVPVLGILAFIPAFFAGAGIPAFKFISALPKPLSYAGPVAGAWMLIGLGYLVLLYRTNPERIRETGRIFLDE